MRRRLWIYDLPLWKDWLFWLTLVAMVGVIPYTQNRPEGGAPAVVLLAVQFGLWGVLPGKMREAARQRRERSSH